MSLKTRGTGNVYRRGKTWWIYYSVDGVLKRESAKTEVKSEASKLLRQRLGEAERGAISIANPQMSMLLDAVVDDYRDNARKSLHDVELRVSALKARWGSTRASNFGSEQVRMHVAERKTTGVKPATINRELSILARAFRLAAERNQVSRIPKITKLREDNTRRGFFTDAEFSQLRAALPAWMRLLVTAAYFTGCRLGELRKLGWKQVDLKARQIRLEATKNGEDRTVPLTAELAAMLEMEPNKTGFVFRDDCGRQIGHYAIYKPWRDACTAVGLEGRLFHDFRRTGVRNMLRAGISEHVAMAISGHKTRSMLTRYAIVSPSDLSAAAAKLDALRSTELSQKPSHLELLT